MNLGALRAAVWILGALAAAVLGLVSAFADLGAATRHSLAVATSFVVLAMFLVLPPRAQPPDGERVPRSPAVAALGRGLIRLLWLSGAAVAAFSSFLLTNGLDETGFQSGTALAVAVFGVLSLTSTGARHLAGFVVDWGFLRRWNIIRHVLGFAATVALAGYAGLLADILETAVPWIPVHLYQALRQWGVWAWVAVLCAGLGFVVVVAALVLVESVLQYGAARILGRDNAVGAWLEEKMPARLVLTDTEYFFQYQFLFEFSTYGPRTPPRVGRRASKRLAVHERPLDHTEEAALVERVADALSAELPPRWANFALTYRAAGRHEELVARLNVMSLPNEAGVSIGEATEWKLEGFEEIDALRRLRAAGYEAGYGTAFEWVLSFDIERGSWHRLDADIVGPRGHASWRPAFDDDEPEWIRRPNRKDYREDLRRFPIVRRARPRWLRDRL